MAKNKKRKKVQPSRQNFLVQRPSKTFLDTCYATARRIFRALNEDESSFDSFTKRQKQDMFRIMIMPPRIQAMPGHKVPKPYLHYIQEELMAHLKREYFNEEEGVSWMDMTTVGQTLMLVFTLESFVESLSEPQRKVVERMCKVFERQELALLVQETISAHIRTGLLMISQPNFRIYGQGSDEHQPSTHRPVLQQIVPITTHECQSLRFKYRNKERTAFRVGMGQFKSLPFTGATIAMRKIFPNASNSRQLDIYVQSHAIHRFKERIDTLFPILRNQFMVLSLMIIQRVVRGPAGMQLIACVAPCKGEDKIIGYFAFTIDGNNLLVLTLLPLLSHNVPEGRILYERLHLSPDDLKYLGMDKLSFFYDVDIEQIPILKKVLFDELHLNYVRKIYNSYHSKNEPYNEKKTLFVKNFFRKLEEQPPNHAEILDDLTDPDL
ncbi:MAG: hypothetical protein LBB84_03730 [Tannerellaceae bacterium]|jgi:hypothetical protein|nr:hypothetical protein [Tannerellaceae bacterium]